jgi:hypothetical protein
VGVINTADGTQVSVAVTSIANSYLSLGSSVTNPLADLRALTVADYTFLVNKKRVIEKSTEIKSEPPEDHALIVVKLGDYEKEYNVYIDDQVVNFDSSIPYIAALSHTNDHEPESVGTYKSGTASTGGIHADTTRIARDLKHLIEGHITNQSGIASVSISNGGTGWLEGQSTGTYSTTRTTRLLPSVLGSSQKYKVVIDQYLLCEITQPTATDLNGNPSTASALLELNVSNGVVDGVSIRRRGYGFNNTDPLAYEFKTYQRTKAPEAKRFGAWSQTTNTGSGIVLSTSVSVRTGLSVEVKGSVIRIKSTDGPFKVRVEDGLADQGLGVVYREVNSITDLPAKCFQDFKVKVIGDADIDQDDYYVRFDTKEKEEFGEGSWIETVGYYQDESPGSVMEGIDTTINSGTMPVTLVPYFNNGLIANFRLQVPSESLVVKVGTNYYTLKQDHTANSETKPETGASWNNFWLKTTSVTQGYLEWTDRLKQLITKVGHRDQQVTITPIHSHHS